MLSSVQAKYSDIDRFIRGRQLSEAEIGRIITMVFRVEAYTRSRQQLTTAKTQDDDSFVRLDPNTDWFLALSKATPYRFYDKAKDYVALVPYRN